MKCKLCNTEMNIDSVENDGNREIFTYVCRNPSCADFGYKDKQQPKKQSANGSPTV